MKLHLWRLWLWLVERSCWVFGHEFYGEACLVCRSPSPYWCDQ